MRLHHSQFDVSQNTFELAQDCIAGLSDVWKRIDDLVFSNQARVLRAFGNTRVSLSHMWPSTGYGYGDAGRDGLEQLFAEVFGGESSLVRLAWTSGTHVLKTALFGLLRPGDVLLSVTGTPYETLRPVIGISSQESEVSGNSLIGLGVGYRECSCLVDFESGLIDSNDLENALAQHITQDNTVILVQRSRGYSSRKTISMESLKRFMEIVGRRWPNVMTFVDNCYCEFTDVYEPPALGVSITAGSLIKNPGGGLAATGGYVVGHKKYVNLVAESLYAPGLGSDAGSNPYGYRDVYQGLFLAPKVVGEALKGACFASLFFSKLGYKTDPGPFESRGDIVQQIIMEKPEALIALARAVQAASPVDSFASPEPWDMPGYSHPVIMAAGTFVQGASIEFSCDGPFIPPYSAYLQGGLTKEHVVYACMKAKDALDALEIIPDR
ncbi:MAG: methionine gamma-lyase family protein [Bacillota bacterium]